MNEIKNYCNQQSRPCRFIVCQGILFFLLQLTRTLTVHNDDGSAMMYLILGAHLCHATVQNIYLALYMMYRYRFDIQYHNYA